MENALEHTIDHVDFLSQLAIVLAAAFIGGALLQRLKQPVLVGYILVGILLGPQMLGVVSSDKEVQLFAELGILLLLFIVGIELDLKKFAPVYRISLSLTVIQIVTGLMAMEILAHFFGWSWQRGVLLGFAVALSSTAVAIKLLQDMGEMDSHLGRITIGVLIAQDLAVIPMLLILGAISSGRDMASADYIRIFGAVAFMALFIFTVSRHPEWLHALKNKAHKYLPPCDQHVIVGLGLCFAAAAVSGALGLSASYGAFLAGILIGHLGNREQYEKEITPIFNVLIMVFFLSVGLMIDFHFLIANWMAVLVLLFVAMLLKTVVNISALRYLGLSGRHAVVIGATLGQIGEFSFVLAALGLAVGTINDEGHKLVVLIIALSLMVTPLWMVAVHRVGQLGRHIHNKFNGGAVSAGPAARIPPVPPSPPPGPENI
jgi:CPA2 family monovalent cation:H+ antiporter-2